MNRIFNILFIFLIFHEIVELVPVNKTTEVKSNTKPAKLQRSNIFPGCILRTRYILCSAKPMELAAKNAATNNFSSYILKFKNFFSNEITNFENILRRAVEYLIVWIAVTVIFVILFTVTYPCYLKAIRAKQNSEML